MSSEPRSEPTSLARLSERERQIALLVARGMKNKDIANELAISENTVKRHLQSIFSKTGTRDRLELAVLAVTELSRAA
jgi:DNA-binding NarL/FixJ family response regulator